MRPGFCCDQVTGRVISSVVNCKKKSVARENKESQPVTTQNWARIGLDRFARMTSNDMAPGEHCGRPNAAGTVCVVVFTALIPAVFHQALHGYSPFCST